MPPRRTRPGGRVRPPTVQFFGAAGTVTGSRHLVTVGNRRVLLDCGLFQGLKELRRRNWDDPPFDPTSLDAVVLSHAHIDHSGYLPLIVRRGFNGPIYCSAATADLASIMLPDSAHLQEEEAARANRYGYTRHEPALPLYTVEDAAATLRLLTPRPMGRAFPVTDGVEVTLRPAGHILGSATVDVAAEGPRGPRRLCFSGDLGRWGRPILKDPAAVPRADVVLCEATYGDRVHPADVDGELARIVIEAAHRGGALLVPAFAVGRTQELLWRLRQLEDDGRVPALPVYLDSPTAIDVTALYLRHAEEHDPDMAELVRSQQCGLCPRNFRAARTPQESKALNDLRGPVIIISASGMATGGRILYHLRLRLPERRTTVLLAGFQAAGTRGRALQDRATQLRIHGQDVPVKASVVTLDGMSAHADRVELLRWLSGFTAPPKALYLVHAEPHAARAFAATARKRLKWPVRIAKDREVVTIAG